MYYVHNDHLGSLNVLTNANGAITQETSYDAWGNRRDPATLQNYATPPTNLITDRGFTGHEHLDAFGLINMNGRVYDPALGRFLSPDPFVADPSSTQDYNRYSYCGNSPLMFTDPSGYYKVQDDDSGGRGNSFWDAINFLLYITPYGGSWTNDGNGGSLHVFFSENEANNAVIDYNNSHNSWRNTIHGSALNGLGNGGNYKIEALTKGAGNSYQVAGVLNNEPFSVASDGNGQFAIMAGGKEISDIIAVALSKGDGHFAMDYLNFGINAGDLYYSIKGEALHNGLYWVQKNGTIRSTSSIGNNYLLRRSYNLTGQLAEGAKIVARNFAYAGTAMSGINMVTDFRFANTFDFAMGLTTFLPGVGWAISGVYFIANVTVQSYTGKTIGEHLEMQLNKIGQ